MKADEAREGEHGSLSAFEQQLVALTEVAGELQATRSDDRVSSASARAALAAVLERAETLASHLGSALLAEARLGTDRRTWCDAEGRKLSPRVLLETADVAEAVRAEWHAAHQRLWRARREGIESSLMSGRAWAHIASGCGTLRRALRAAGGLDPVGVPARPQQNEIEARRLLARLGRWVASARAAPTPAAQLRRAGTALAWLIGHRNADCLGVVEALELGRFRDRVRTSITADRPVAPVVSRLLEELADLVAAGRATYRRRLAAQDEGVIGFGLTVLSALAPESTLPCALVEPLGTLEGRDYLLDELLAEGACAGDVLARLLCLHAEVVRSTPSSNRRPSRAADSRGAGAAVGAA